MTSITFRTTAKAQYRAHRATCKRQGGMPEVTATHIVDQEACHLVKAATCCKPTRDDVAAALDEALTELTGDPRHTPDHPQQVFTEQVHAVITEADGAPVDVPAPAPAPVVTRKGRKVQRKSGDPRTDRQASLKRDLPGKGEQIGLRSAPVRNRPVYEVRWVHGHDVLAKLVSGPEGAAKWLVQDAAGNQRTASSAKEGDRIGRELAKALR